MVKVNISQCEYLVENNIYLVIKIAQRFSVSYLDREDLIQAGLYGLYKAATKFDVSKGNKFSTYAVYFIIGAMKDELKKLSLMKNDVVILKEDLDDVKSHYLNLDHYGFTKLEKEILHMRLNLRYNQQHIGKILNISQSSISRILKSIKIKILDNKNSIY